ncbi:hypothetical protein OESDEN_16136 [Oesophagostomum dentatum]|uniref:CC domain-containing protein n=1 Tax=Oesophagostomum dentatum TaxID=61180 RepID=A0A0B1SGY5_OESDE|nr:hypothetical protein OESDEN_16136 [Oesophagostomum dentatum]
MLRGLRYLLSVTVIGCLVQSSHQQATGVCPNGVQSLPIDCDPKHPWPRCPPQTYCYATNSVDVGPYYCCPAGSTIATLFYLFILGLAP